jgi:hypothetical protein
MGWFFDRIFNPDRHVIDVGEPQLYLYTPGGALAPAGEGPLNYLELETLACYNSEVRRGIMHTSEWREAMEALQKRYMMRATPFSEPGVEDVGKGLW